MRVSSTLQLQWPARARVALLGALLLLLAVLPRPSAAADWSLLMVEQTGCTYCARWHAEVAPEYPTTPEGRFAPLRRVDLRDLPDDVTFRTRPVYTPTFVLLRDGEEVGRIEGYPGEDFFWGLLGHLLDRADATWATQETDG